MNLDNIKGKSKQNGHNFSPVDVNMKYEVPHLAGYSVDGKTLYIDRRLPKKFGKMDVYHYIKVHELVEKSLEDHLGLDYDLAHDLANAAEKFLVERDGHDWEDYDMFINEWDARIGKNAVDAPPRHRRCR